MDFFFKAPEVCALACIVCALVGLLSYQTSNDKNLTVKQRSFFYVVARRLFLTSGVFLGGGVLFMLAWSIFTLGAS